MLSLLIKGLLKYIPENRGLFWDVKIKMEILEKKQKPKNRNGHAFRNGTINSKQVKISQ